MKLKFVICRFATIFGPSIGMRFHTAVNKFCWQAIIGKPLTVWETALDQERPYLGVKDAVKTIKFLLKNDVFDNEIYNVLSSNKTVREIINYIRFYVPDLEISMVKSKIMNSISHNVESTKLQSKGIKLN